MSKQQYTKFANHRKIHDTEYITMTNVKDILTLLPTSLSKDDKALIEKAYKFAKDAHEGQKRYSGEPYFNHVFQTAKILAELGMGAKSISAGLLHDTLEDVEEVNAVQIESEFGKEVLFLVEGVTKLGHVRYRGLKRHVESLRKLFVATSQDIRVLIIKLADRLHNMRTLEHVPDHKQKRIAEETMRVYAPVAHRLGMGRVKGELEDLAFPFIYPDAYKKTVELSKGRYKVSEERLEKVYKRLRKELAKEDLKPVKTDNRRKHLYSLYLKLKRKEMDIDRVYDIIALRIVMKTVSECYQVLGIVHSLWRPLPGRIKDYIAFEKPNGYQSIHTTILTGDGGVAEIQIRTEEMHKKSEYGIASHVGYKAQQEDGSRTSVPLSWFADIIPLMGRDAKKETGSKPTTEIPKWITEIAEAEKEVRGSDELLAHLESDFLKDRIFVFTPKGDVIDLPSESTPIDFAYHIHSDIGDHATAAKINGKMVSLDTQLSNGDIVEIEIDKNRTPSRKWLQYSKSSLAQRKIRSAINKDQEE